MNYRFMSDGSIQEDDLLRIQALTRTGDLVWSKSDGYYAINAHPASPEARADQAVSERIIGENLKGVRIGFDPEKGEWLYMRMTSHYDVHEYIEPGSNEHLYKYVNGLILLLKELQPEVLKWEVPA